MNSGFESMAQAGRSGVGNDTTGGFFSILMFVCMADSLQFKCGDFDQVCIAFHHCVVGKISGYHGGHIKSKDFSLMNGIIFIEKPQTWTY